MQSSFFSRHLPRGLVALVDEGGHHPEGEIAMVPLQVEHAKHGSGKVHACTKNEKIGNTH
jgi:hypothetical protein